MSRIVRLSHRSWVSCDDAGEGFGLGLGFDSDDADCGVVEEASGLILIPCAGCCVSLEGFDCAVVAEDGGFEAATREASESMTVAGGVAVGVAVGVDEDEDSGFDVVFVPLDLDAGEAAEEPPSLARRLLRICQATYELRDATHAALDELRESYLVRI